MKKYIFISIFATLFTCVLFSSCSKYDADLDLLSESTVTSYSYLDFQLTRSGDTDAQYAAIEEAGKRMDAYVQFKDGQFILSSCTPEKVGLSPDLFNHMKELMKAQNDFVKTLKIGSYYITPQNTIRLIDKRSH